MLIYAKTQTILWLSDSVRDKDKEWSDLGPRRKLSLRLSDEPVLQK